MSEDRAAVTIKLDQYGEIISVKFDNGEEITQFDHFPLKDPPPAQFIGSRSLGEMWFYKTVDESVARCIKLPSCACVGDELMQKIIMEGNAR